MARTISKKAVMRGLLLGAIVVGCILDRHSIERYQMQVQERRDATVSEQNEQTQEETRAKQIQSDSETALSRARSGCVRVELTANNKPAFFYREFRVFDANTFPRNPKTPRFDADGNPINGVKPIPSGVTVCNPLGDTAIVGNNGFVTRIKRVEQSKLKEFRSYLK